VNRLSPNAIAHKISGKVILYNDQFALQKDEIRYGLESLLLTLNQLLLILILALPFGILPEALILYFAHSILRTFSGGAHFQRYLTCLIYGTLSITLSSLAIVHFYHTWAAIKPLLIILLTLSFVLVIWKAPVLYKNKGFFTQKQLLRKKCISTFLFIFLFIISIIVFNNTSLMYAIWFALILQSLTLTKTVYVVFSLFK